MFVYRHLSRRGIRLALPRHPLARLLLGAAGLVIGLVVAAVALVGAILLAAWALGRSVLRGGRPRPSAADVVSPSVTRARAPAPRDGRAEDVSFRELP